MWKKIAAIWKQTKPQEREIHSAMEMQINENTHLKK